MMKKKKKRIDWKPSLREENIYTQSVFRCRLKPAAAHGARAHYLRAIVRHQSGSLAHLRRWHASLLPHSMSESRSLQTQHEAFTLKGTWRSKREWGWLKPPDSICRLIKLAAEARRPSWFVSSLFQQPAALAARSGIYRLKALQNNAPLVFWMNS